MKAKSGKFKLALKVILSLVLIYFIVYAAVFFYSLKEHLPRKSKDLERTARILHLENFDGQYLKRIETHKGFFNNGYYYSEIQFTEETDIADQLEHQIEFWRKLPMPSGIKKDIVETNRYGFDEYKINEKIVFPFFDQGYYFFTFPGQKSSKKNTDKVYNLKNYEGDLNYTLALYNTSTRVLYFFDFDDNN